MSAPAQATRRAAIGEFRHDRPSKATTRHLVRIGALPTLPRGRTHLTRDILEALERVGDGLAWLREAQRLAGLPPKNFSDEAAWQEWCRQHPHAVAGRGANAARLASRALRRAQGDLFAGMAGRV